MEFNLWEAIPWYSKIGLPVLLFIIIPVILWGVSQPKQTTFDIFVRYISHIPQKKSGIVENIENDGREISEDEMDSFLRALEEAGMIQRDQEGEDEERIYLTILSRFMTYERICRACQEKDESGLLMV